MLKSKVVPRTRHQAIGFQAAWVDNPPTGGMPHMHDELEFNFCASGAVTYAFPGGARQLLPGRLAAFWGAIPHFVSQTAPGTRMVWITLPLPWLRAWGLDAPALQPLFDGAWLEEPLSPGSASRYPFASWLRECLSDPGRPSLPLQLELRAACLRLIAGGARHFPRKVPPSGALERLIRQVALDYAEPVTVQEIARRAGLHPKYAMQRFRATQGVTLAHYLRRFRISQAGRMLLTTDWNILRVAGQCGFHSASAFYRAFAAACGCTPRAYRNSSGIAPNPDRPGAPLKTRRKQSGAAAHRVRRAFSNKP